MDPLVIFPPVGDTSPAMAFNNVDLPDPFGPTIPILESEAISIVTFSKSVLSGVAKLTFSKSITFRPNRC